MTKQTFTIGEVAKKYSISRSTLIYYDTIQLLTPSGRSEANYRLYSATDLQRMDKISQYRGAGLSLKTISRILDDENKSKSHTVLEMRLFAINTEIKLLRTQQKIILQLLENEDLRNHSRIITKEKWVQILQATGLDENDMDKWHIEFEKLAPEAHQDFLESLGIRSKEINSIREFSQKGKVKRNYTFISR